MRKLVKSGSNLMKKEPAAVSKILELGFLLLLQGLTPKFLSEDEPFALLWRRKIKQVPHVKLLLHGQVILSWTMGCAVTQVFFLVKLGGIACSS